jgi:hypothetical protein
MVASVQIELPTNAAGITKFQRREFSKQLERICASEVAGRELGNLRSPPEFLVNFNL